MKKSSLKKMYYSLFVLLIVLPIIVVVIGGMRLLREQLAEEANNRILLMQQNMVDTLERESKDAALRLSHFLYAGKDMTLGLLSRIPKDLTTKYFVQQELNHLFQLVVLPKENLEAIHFYMKGDVSFQLKNDLAIPLSQLRQTAWYRRTLQETNIVHIGTMDSDTLIPNRVSRGKFLLVAALAIEERMSHSELEMACLYFETSLEQQIAYHQAENPTLKIALLDSKQQILIGDPAFQLDFDAFLQDPETFSKTGYALVHRLSNSDLQLITLVDHGALLADYNKASLQILAISLIVFLLYGLFSTLFLKNIIQPINLLSAAMQCGGDGGAFPCVQPQGQKELQMLILNFNKMSTRIKTLLIENQKREQEKYREEFKALQAEINPHFLLNTINTIRFMADIAQFSSIRDMSASLMEILSCILRNPTRKYTLRDESKILESYAKILQIRYSDAFQIEQMLAPDTLDCIFPKLLLQPVVENSILHGLPQLDREGVVKIESRIQDELLHITVWDNGIGMTPEQVDRCLNPQGKTDDEGLGLHNVQRRVQLYGQPENSAMRIFSQPNEYTLVEITLPVVKGKDAIVPRDGG